MIYSPAGLKLKLSHVGGGMRLSTVAVPREFGDTSLPRYETCVFGFGDSEVLGTAKTALDARAIHFYHARRLGIVPE